MSRKCFVTGKSAKAGNARSHSMRATRRTWGVNAYSRKWQTKTRIC